MKKLNYNIVEEKNIIDDNLLDIIGNEFKFDHEKGIAEWIKNSVDAYIRSSVPDSKQVIIIRFNDKDRSSTTFECIDFNGMTSIDIDKALKRWGDPEAARRGLQKKVYGGHGNGGKFYMRQMFKKSHFITYKNGLLNIFGFNENKKYGFASKFKNKKIKWKEAFKVAEIAGLKIPEEYLNKIKRGEFGFTVVKGVIPRNLRKINPYKICDKLRRHPQSMRIMDRVCVSVMFNNDIIFNELKPDKIKPLQNFEEPTILSIPKKIENNQREIYLADNKYSPGKLILKTSEVALSANSRFTDLNRIDIIGEVGVIASYHLRELGLYYPQTDFIYGECECPILEDPNDDYVKNDRSKLSEGEKSDALLGWIKQQVKELCEKISEEEEKEREDLSQKISSDFNNFLDQWKNKFMSRVFSEILIGSGDGPGGGVGGSGLLGQYSDGRGSNKKSGGGQGEEGSGEESKKGPHFPKVLLSGWDDDPLNIGNKLFLQPEQGLVYQRVQDVKEGIYWINTASPLASAIIDKYGANSVRWRDYLFQRYVDIFIKESLIKLEKREPERFNAATIDGEILGKVVTTIHNAAAKDLESFLFDERYVIKE